MGRQIAINFSDKKEKEFVDFLLSNKDVILINPWSEEEKLNILEKLPALGRERWVLYIWNKSFKFTPEFIKLVKTSKKDSYKYKLHYSGTPVIQFLRNKDQPGRLYWEKYFTTSNPYYDVEEFEKWYDEVIKWVKKSCKYEKGVYKG